jgi:hypothetical protein
MQAEQRIEKLERSVRRLSLVAVGATAFSLGVFLTGLGAPSQAESFQPVAVDNPAGFVVLPGQMAKGLHYTVVEKSR